MLRVACVLGGNALKSPKSAQSGPKTLDIVEDMRKLRVNGYHQPPDAERLLVGQSSNCSRSYSSFSNNSQSFRLKADQFSSKTNTDSTLLNLLRRLRLVVGLHPSFNSYSSYTNRTQQRLRLILGQVSSKTKLSYLLERLRFAVHPSSNLYSSYTNRTQRLKMVLHQSSNSYSSYSNKIQRLRLMEQEYAVTKDTVLFRYNNTRFVKFINIFAFSQFCFWTYLSHFAFVTMKNVNIPKEVKDDDSLPWWRKTNFGQFRYGITIASFLIGWGTLAVSWMYTLRSVRTLVLLKGGRELTFVTTTPLGRSRQLTVPLEKVSAVQSRMSVKAHLPLKVQGTYLHYLLDMRGQFTNTKLFDYSAGLRRSWAK